MRIRKNCQGERNKQTFSVSEMQVPCTGHASKFSFLAVKVYSIAVFMGIRSGHGFY